MGRFGTLPIRSVTIGPDGKVSVPNRPNGLVIYNNAGQQTVSLKRKAVQKIIEQ